MQSFQIANDMIGKATKLCEALDAEVPIDTKLVAHMNTVAIRLPLWPPNQQPQYGDSERLIEVQFTATEITLLYRDDLADCHEGRGVDRSVTLECDDFIGVAETLRGWTGLPIPDDWAFLSFEK